MRFLIFQRTLRSFFLRTFPANAPSLNQRVFHRQEVELTHFTAEQVEIVIIDCSENICESKLWMSSVVTILSPMDEISCLG